MAVCDFIFKSFDLEQFLYIFSSCQLSNVFTLNSDDAKSEVKDPSSKFKILLLVIMNF